MSTDCEQRGPRLSVDELRQAAAEMRAMDIIDIFAAGSGHPGGTLSIMDIAAALYLRVLNHDPKDPAWPDRDRVFWSTGHKAPALYVALGKAGYFPLEDTVLLRQLGSGFEGHPNWLKLPGVEVSSGSLGQGLGIAVGNALAGKAAGQAVPRLLHHGRRRAAGRQHLGSGHGGGPLSAGQPLRHRGQERSADRRLGARGDERGPAGGEVRGVQLERAGDRRPRSGQDSGGVRARARRPSERPTVIIAHTVKGKGVSFMENEAGWHGVAPNREQFEKAMVDLADAFGAARARGSAAGPGRRKWRAGRSARRKTLCRTSAAITGGTRARR